MNKTYCQVGTPVQFGKFEDGDTYILFPAVINVVRESRVDILVLCETPFIAENVDHVDFFKKGNNFWQYIPQDHAAKFDNGKQRLFLNKSKP